MVRRATKLVSLLAAALFLISGCAAPSTTTQSVLLGTAGGAVLGSGLGCLTAYTIDKDDPTSYAIGCTTGALIGAAIGATAGYLLAPPPPPPPPPKRVVKAPTPTPPPPTPTPRERLVLRGVHFDFDKYNIRPEDEPILDEAADTLKAHSDVTVYVDGYCDIVGSMEYNQRLSERRAASVVKYLQSRGVSSDRMIPRGFGKTHFVATNDTAEGRAQNRRVELVPVGGTGRLFGPPSGPTALRDPTN